MSLTQELSVLRPIDHIATFQNGCRNPSLLDQWIESSFFLHLERSQHGESPNHPETCAVHDVIEDARSTNQSRRSLSATSPCTESNNASLSLTSRIVAMTTSGAMVPSRN